MSEEIFEIIKAKNLISRQKIKTHNIMKLTRTELIDITSQIVEESKNIVIEKEKNFYSLCASPAIGGSRSFCAYPKCRLERLDKLARFSAIYSNRIYIRNFFLDYAHFENTPIEKLREYLLDDIALITYIRPLLYHGLITMYTPASNHICPTCSSIHGSELLTEETRRKIIKAAKRLNKEFLENTEVDLEYSDDSYSFLIKGPDKLIDHGAKYFTPYNLELLEPILSKPRLSNKLHNDGHINLSKTMKKHYGFHKHLAFQVFESISYEMVMSQLVNSSFITNKDIDIEFLNDISGAEYKNVNNVIHNNLTTIIPFIDDLPIKELLKVRRNEGDSINEFRSALKDAIANVISNKTNITESDAKEIYEDIIAPKLSSMDRKLKNAKNSLAKKPLATAFGTVSALSIGLYTGLIPTEFTGLAATLGLLNVVSEITKEIFNIGEAKSEIQNEDFYFLWKVLETSKK